MLTRTMKEPANTWTHFIPFLASGFGLVILVLGARDSLSRLIVMLIYGISVMLLYGASSLYHWRRTTAQRELLLRKIDHIAIYVLIAGSYTPVLYFGLSGGWRWSMLGTVWGLAIVGMILKLWFVNAPRWVTTAFYLALGWIAVIPFYQLVHTLPAGAIVLMVLGGLSYTVGAVIYGTKAFSLPRLHLGFHEVFHLFVVLGSLLHFLMMVIFILPL